MPIPVHKNPSPSLKNPSPPHKNPSPAFKTLFRILKILLRLLIILLRLLIIASLLTKISSCSIGISSYFPFLLSLLSIIPSLLFSINKASQISLLFFLNSGAFLNNNFIKFALDIHDTNLYNYFMEREDKEGKLMLLTVYSILDNPDNHFITLRPGLVLPKGLLHDKVLEILQTETKANSPLFGDTTDKKNKYNAMCYAMFHITSAATAYFNAPLTASPELNAKVNFTLPRLLNLPYNEAQAFMQGIINVVTPIIGNLESYGAKQSHLDHANQKFADFIAVQTKPQTNIAYRKALNANIHPLVQQGIKLLKDQIDPIINTLFTEHHTLYSLYYNARQIINLPHGTTVVEGYVYKSDGVSPVYNAIIKFPEQDITAKTLIDGSFRLIKFPHGITTPEVTYGNSHITSGPFEVKLGHTLKCTFKLPE